MNRSGKSKRPYRAPQREASAARTREAILGAATRLFEEAGWAGTTMRAIGSAARVSQKTVEALFGTKAAVLRASVDYAIRGDIDPLPIAQREAVARMEAAPTAAEMLALHAAHLRAINERSAGLAWAVEQGAPGDSAVMQLWQEMNRNRAYGVGWATETLLAKPGRRHRLARREVESTFWVALDWATYRTLTEHAGLSPNEFERWLIHFYRAMLQNEQTR